MSAEILKRDILPRPAEELESKLHVEIELLTRKNGRKVTGYDMTIREPHHFSPMIQEDIPFDLWEDYKWVQKWFKNLPKRSISIKNNTKINSPISNKRDKRPGIVQTLFQIV